jgi:hypothetical protein
MNKRTNPPGVTAHWRKSSYSGAHGDCVEVREAGPGLVAVRDSKDPHGPALAFGVRAWAAFVADLTAGAVGRL